VIYAGGSCVTVRVLSLMSYMLHVLMFASNKMASDSDTRWQKDAADQNFDYMFKLLIIGNGIDFKVKTVFRQDNKVKLQIWVNHPYL